MKKIFLLLLAFPFVNEHAQLQDTVKYSSNYSIVVDSILITGAESTKNYIIEKEITFADGDTLTPDIALYNRERIYSLGIFNQVTVYPLTVNKINYAVVAVEEGWYIYPVPFLELRDNDWKKLSYGAILVLKNFQGKNETLSLSGALGYNPFLRLRYFDPYFIQDANISINLSGSYGTVSNRSNIASLLYGNDFDQKVISGGVEVGKRFGLYTRLSVSAGYNYVETPFFIKGISASDSRIDHSPYIAGGFSYDTRDLIQFPKTGLLAAASVEFKGLGVNGINYQVSGFDFREYRKLIGDLYGKWRFTTRLTGGKIVPYYDLSFIGYDERIRGHYRQLLEGNNYYLGSVELFYPIIKDISINLDFIPLLPRELLSYRVALYTEVFGDAGTTKFKGQSISINDIRSGYGGGFTLLILPYNVVRFEVGLDEYRNAEFILNVSASF
jgi:outer membrane protein assembly factor BamA